MEPKKIRFSQSARKHRIGKAHTMWVISHYQPIKLLAQVESGKADRLVWAGRDERGLELEVIAIELDESLLVIHVMPRSFRRGKENG